MTEIDQQGFAAAHATGAVVIDVREPHEYVAGHVPGAQLVPLGTLAASAGQLDRSATVYVICATGNRSLTAARALAGAGFDALSVQGGTSAWIAAGRPVVRGTQAQA